MSSGDLSVRLAPEPLPEAPPSPQIRQHVTSMSLNEARALRQTGGLGVRLPPLHVGGPKKRSRKNRKSGGSRPSRKSRKSRRKHTRRH